MLFSTPNSLLATTFVLSALVSAAPRPGVPGSSVARRWLDLDLGGEPVVARRTLTAAQKLQSAEAKAAVAAKAKAKAKVKAAAVAAASKSKSKSSSLSKSKSMSLSKSKALAAAKNNKATTTKKTTTPAAKAVKKKTTTKSTTVKTTTTKTSAAPAIKTLAAGTSYLTGSISPTFRWQSSGILTSGCPPGIVGLNITTCYHAHLAATGMLQSTTGNSRTRAFDAEGYAAKYDDPIDSYFDIFPDQLAEIVASTGEHVESGLARRQVSCSTGGASDGAASIERQRIEMYSYPGAAAGEQWAYTWKSFQAPNASTTGNFFHSWQLLHRNGCTGPVIASDLEITAEGSRFIVADFVPGRTCVTEGTCTSIPLSEFEGRTVMHSIRVTYGTSGSFVYSAVDVANATAPMISYSATGDMGSSSSIKFGQYRMYTEGLSQVDSYVGDYSAHRLA